MFPLILEIKFVFSRLQVRLTLVNARPKNEGERRARLNGRGETLYYHEFLKLRLKRGIRFNQSHTSAEIAELSAEQFSAEDVGELREIYINARYGGIGRGKADIRRAREALRRLR